MKENFEVNCAVRVDEGKGASRRLRRTGMVPGVIYGAHKEPLSITVKHSEMLKHLEHEAFYSHILTLKFEDREEKAILKDLQRHPAKPFIMHADFQRVSASEKLRTHVPLHFLNEASCPGVKTGGGIVSHHMTGVEVSCLPANLPEYIEVDLGAMVVGDSVHLADLKLPEGVELVALTHGTEENAMVVSIHGPNVAQEESAEA